MEADLSAPQIMRFFIINAIRSVRAYLAFLLYIRIAVLEKFSKFFHFFSFSIKRRARSHPYIGTRFFLYEKILCGGSPLPDLTEEDVYEQPQFNFDRRKSG
jgi:hypothetical protein